MKKIISLLIIVLTFTGLSYSQDEVKIESINKLIEMRDRIKDIHPALENLYPIAVYKDSTFKIYDFNPEANSYQLTKTTPSLRYIIKGIRAAFPLEENDYKMTCVVSDDAFATARDMSIIFHEFVHCYQYETVEYELKSSLDVFADAMENKNYMWELNYPFPYQDSVVAGIYNSFINEIENSNLTGAEEKFDELKKNLEPYEYQYISWVQWKEGSARWIENRIRTRLKVNPNVAGSKGELNRVSFYYGGSKYIELLSKQYKTENLKSIFELIYNN